MPARYSRPEQSERPQAAVQQAQRLLEQLRQSRAIGNEDRYGLLEGLLVGDDSHPRIVRGLTLKTPLGV